MIALKMLFEELLPVKYFCAVTVNCCMQRDWLQLLLPVDASYGTASVYCIVCRVWKLQMTSSIVRIFACSIYQHLFTSGTFSK